MSLRLTGKGTSARGDLIEAQPRRRLERLPGVAGVEVEGVPVQEVLVAIDPDRLTANGVGLHELVQRLQSSNFSVSAGRSDDGRRAHPARARQRLQECEPAGLSARPRLADIADVTLQPQRMNYVRQVDGRPAVGVDIYKERAANLVDLSRAVQAEIAGAQNDPAMRGIAIDITDDQGQQVVSSLVALAEPARSAWPCRSSCCGSSCATGRRC